MAVKNVTEEEKYNAAGKEQTEPAKAPSYGVNYNDGRFTQVNNDKQQALTELENTYGGMAEEAEKYYQAQIDATKAWEQKQAQLQQERTDFAIEQIEQQKDQTTKDYKREQSGAYVDWQKQSNQYGVNAEQMASAGFMNSGYSESSQVSMYNTYQNRVATARESYVLAIQNYNNAIKDARLQNNAALAEIAYKSLQQQLELSLNGFQYKNQLIDNLYTKKTELDNTYYNRYQDVLAQINHENALAEEIRQYEQNYAFQQDKYKTEQTQWQKEYDLKQDQWKKEYELSQAKLKEEQRQFDAQMAEEQRQYNASLAAANAKANSGAIRSTSGGSNSGGNKTVNSNKSNIAVSGKTGSSWSGNTGQGGSAQSSAKASTNNYDKPYYRVTQNMGNSKSTQKKSDYYFSNGYQPRYIDNVKLQRTGYTAGDLNKNYGVAADQNVWECNGRLYLWDGKTREYMYIGKA
jgi:hypothetical protein